MVLALVYVYMRIRDMGSCVGVVSLTEVGTKIRTMKFLLGPLVAFSRKFVPVKISRYMVLTNLLKDLSSSKSKSKSLPTDLTSVSFVSSLSMHPQASLHPTSKAIHS